MHANRYAVIAIVVLGFALLPSRAATQAGDSFSARLAWVPTTTRDRANVTGSGSATGRLSGESFTVAGTFEKLAAPATAARLHRGVATGARGPALADLTITKAVSGSISGTVTLTKEQIEELRQGKLYLQVHSEKGVEDGSVLWGWFLK